MGIIDRLKNPGIVEFGIAGTSNSNSSTTRGALVGTVTGVGLGFAKKAYN